MRKILVATEKPFAPVAIKKISKIFEKEEKEYDLVLLENYTDRSQLLQAVADADALIVRSDKVDAEVFDVAPKLKIVVRAGAGYDNVDCSAATAKGVVVMNTPGQNSNAVAELAIGLAILGIREMFSGKPGSELRGRTLGLHGFGYVARNVFRIARALGMKVIVYTRYSKGAAAAIGLKVTKSLEQLYEKSDVVSIHVPARGEHIKSVSYQVMKHLKDGAVIVNTARKEVVNEPDLVKIMEEKPNIKYMSDLTPDCEKEFAEKFSGRYFFTPKKAGAQTAEANINAGVAAAEQIVAFFEKGDTSYQVNK
ncbi:D-3-phosphoglycerate dehydrogenase [Mariniphaga anaerophila]|uniref:D-3-phosphoglycerate dehydrogenase n=1 Tax=Mariniphaga anaerophila TaxID=1484053 RepID=A0A1M4TGJ3_9BACT|nr:NAD(P)-dependent oxidoreductase [Mariniphaga anaerophila]SHE43610.1 D-3-phosphoglycerate dehydrogenase [Mariniphaga anaerophila]